MPTFTVRPGNWTVKQRIAAKLLNGVARFILLFGGSRSGKTRLIVEWVVRCCYNVAGLRVLILRYRRIHAKDTVWNETLLSEVLPRYAGYEINKSDLCIRFANGSEIWVGGTDDPARVEKLLGRGVGLVYLNEASQISYSACTLVRTRLSQKLEYTLGKKKGRPWVPKLIADCNPPAPTHWTHRLFIDHKEPRDGRELDPESYVAMRINPTDNLDNLPEGYIRDLEELPFYERQRFLHGEWTKPEGAIFPEFGEALLIDEAPECERYVVGVDLVTYAAVLIGIQRYNREGEARKRVYVIDEWSRPGALAHEANEAILAKWEDDYEFTMVIDHNLGKAGTREFENSKLANKEQGSVEAGIVVIQTMMHNDEFMVCRRCTNTRYELENYHRDENGAIVKEDDHHTDATRMVIYTEVRKKRRITVA